MYFMIIWLTDTSFHAILKTFLHPICLIFFFISNEEEQCSDRCNVSARSGLNGMPSYGKRGINELKEI